MFAEHTGIAADDAAGIAKLAEQLGFNPVGKHPDVVKSFVFEEQVEDALAGPVFVLDYPASICPLTKRKATIRRLPSGSSCSSKAWKWPTPTPS